MKNNNYCVIMAGGVGSRFWPLSRESKPKQFVDALGVGKTFIQMTYERFAELIPAENFVVVTGEKYKELVLEQLPMLKSEQVLTEPCRRNTAPCIASATWYIKQQNPNATIVVTPSDQLVLNVPEFVKVIKSDLAFAAEKEALVTIGITPTFPATGYGYIQVTGGSDVIRKVEAFKEKPDLDTAKQFIDLGNYVWNSGMFIWSVSTIEKAFRTYLPEIAEEFDLAYNHGGSQETIDKAFSACPSVSIDYGVMEKANEVYVSPAEFGWSDVGTWGSLYDQLEKHTADNAVSGSETIFLESEACLVKQLNSEKLVVIDGLTDYMVVDTDDVLMICRKGNETHVKQVIEQV
ncbi:MAG: mannose-1-phosphate guanylyltransferase, partial [Bacteroidales bacterium]